MAKKPNRKGLMEVIGEYQAEEKKKRETKRNAESLGSAAGRGSSKPKPKPKPTSKPKITAKPKTAGKAGSSTKAQPPKAPASVQKGNGDGTYGKSMPSNPQYKNVTMKPRKKRPGTGRTGEAAAKAANRSSAPKKKPMTAAERRKMRLRARRGR